MKIVNIFWLFLVCNFAIELNQMAKKISENSSWFNFQNIDFDFLNFEQNLDLEKVKLLPQRGKCGNHWKLCPNMCQTKKTLQNRYKE